MSQTQLVALLGYLLLTLFAIRPVLSQLSTAKIQHLVFGSAAALAVLWWFRTGIYQGLEIHFLWMTALTLLLGWRWALFSSLLANAVLVGFGIIEFANMGVYGVIGCVVPILFSYLAYVLAYQYLPRHFFVYTFFCSFFIGALSIALKMWLMASYFTFSDLHSWNVVSDNYLILIPLLLFPEGLLNGMTMTLLIVYKPEWVATFYDSQYIDGK